MLQDTAHSVPAKKLACYNEGFMKVNSGLSWGWKRMCCSNVHPFCFFNFWIPCRHYHVHPKMHIDTKTWGLRTITTSEIDIKDNICLTEEHGANKALTYTDLKPHKETALSLPSLPFATHCCHSQKMSRDTACSHCYCSLDTGISTVPVWFESTKSCHFAKSLPICLVFKN